MANFKVSKKTMDRVKAMEGEQLVPKQDTRIWGILHVEPFGDNKDCGDALVVRDGNYEYTYKGEKGFKKFLEDWEVR